MIALIAAAAATAVLVRYVATSPKERSSVVDLASQIARADFLRPVLLLGAATAALSAGGTPPPAAAATSREHLKLPRPPSPLRASVR
jgi:hypothetical protein